MKKYFSVLFYFFIGVLITSAYQVEASLPLTGRSIIIDPGHGSEDPGATYKNIYEKDINLSISKYLEKELIKLGAQVLLTREGDYDLSNPKANYRKKSDFDNRIKMINNSSADIYLSIHLNYLSDLSYSGPQVFYYRDNKALAKVIQENMNNILGGLREVKEIPKDTYMFNKLKIPGVLIECGFISNNIERNKLIKKEYQEKIAKAISLGILEYY